MDQTNYDTTNIQTVENKPNVTENQASVAPQPIPIFETAHTKTLRANNMFFGPLTLAYAVFYTFCMYKNQGGITFPFFVAGTVAYLYLCVSKLGITLRKNSYFSMICAVLISVSTVLTGDGWLWGWNKMAILLLVVSVAIDHFYETGKWSFGKWFTAFMRSTFGSFSCIHRPFTDAHAYNKASGKKGVKMVMYVLLGVLIAIPVALISLALLSSADAIFREGLEKITEYLTLEDAMGIVWKMFAGFVGTYMFLAYLCKHMVKEKLTDTKTFEPIIGITATGILTFIYLIFSGIQFAYLFIGNLKLPEGYTYAEYAREGCFELFAVSVLNLVVVLAALAFFKENKVLKGILVILSLCTYVMIASAALRMYMYISAYHLTNDRVNVIWALATIAIIFVGVQISIFKPDFKLFHYTRTVVAICYIILAFARPDYIVASYNLSQPEVTDQYYIGSLSTDAADAIADNIDKLDPACVNDFSYEVQNLEREQTFRNFNFSHARAIKLFGTKGSAR